MATGSVALTGEPDASTAATRYSSRCAGEARRAKIRPDSLHVPRMCKSAGMSSGARTLARMPKDSPRWHPLLATMEPEPGTWILLDSHGKPYGLVTIVKIEERVRFKAEHIGNTIGYATTLREAVERTHAAELATIRPDTPPKTMEEFYEQAGMRQDDMRNLFLSRLKRRYRLGE